MPYETFQEGLEVLATTQDIDEAIDIVIAWHMSYAEIKNSVRMITNNDREYPPVG